MPTDRCRACHQPLVPIATLENMPATAQFLPTENELADDAGVDLRLTQCAGCGLVQLANDPVPYYREVIRAAAYSAEMCQFRESQFAGFVRKHNLAGKTILEVGCGQGEYLTLLSRSGVATSGVEYNKDSVARCRKEGMDVLRGFVDAGYQDPRRPFDAFAVLSYLEHIPDIQSFLQGIRSNLKNDAVGLVEVPNFSMMKATGLATEFMTDHLCYFSTDTLASTLQLNGFEVLELQAIWHDYIISATVRKRSLLDFGEIFDMRKLEESLKGYLDRFQPGSVALWGAGHQALAMIAMAGIGARIRYIVDSAPFKQGRYSPVTHIPIVPPSRLRESPVEAILIAAGSYSDEVAKVVRRDFGAGIALAIVRPSGLEVI